ncbi:MAG: PD40 domain-containing protein [Acidobacteria bacterium]|nr:PD40 domain-containing protein [Acidobacteriota bacterium]MBI3656377.1 PD40 domain-containing protein [Acidobacteriota bacterium]
MSFSHRRVLWLMGIGFAGFCLVTLGVLGLKVRGIAEAPAGAIAFVAYRGDSWNLFLMSEAGSGVRQLTKTPIDERAPALSQDRKVIAYSNSNGELWTVNLTNDRHVKLNLPKGFYNSPRWSPDGEELVFVAHEATAQSEDADILSYQMKTGKVKTVIKQTGIQMYPTFAGRYRILYSTALVGPGTQVIQQLWSYDLQKGRAEQLLMSNANDMQPDYSRGRQRIAFASNKEGSFDLWTVDEQGHNLQRLTSDPAAETNPCWSPDGSRLVFVSNRSGQSELWTIRADGQDMKKLSPFGVEAVPVKDPDWK